MRLRPPVLLLVFAAVPLNAGETAVVPPDLRRDAAYAEYACTLIELELLSRPTTASLQVRAVPVEPGVLALSGGVADARLRQHLLGTARRISGLAVRDELVTMRSHARFTPQTTAEGLQSTTTELLADFFPRVAAGVRASVSEDGAITLNGTAPSLEAKAAVSRTLKSQPGCTAVVNRLLVEIDPRTGALALDAAGTRRLAAARLPAIPPGRGLPSAEAEARTRPTVRQLRRHAADDAPLTDAVDEQLAADVRQRLAHEPSLVQTPVQVDAESGKVTLQAAMPSNRQVLDAVEAAAAAPNVRTVVANCTPCAILQQRLAPGRERAVEAAPRRLLGFIPLPGGDDTLDAGDCRRLERLIGAACRDRLWDLDVRAAQDGMLIAEAKVASARDRRHVFGQLEDLPALKDRDHRIVLHLREK